MIQDMLLVLMLLKHILVYLRLSINDNSLSILYKKKTLMEVNKFCWIITSKQFNVFMSAKLKAIKMMELIVKLMLGIREIQNVNWYLLSFIYNINCEVRFIQFIMKHNIAWFTVVQMQHTIRYHLFWNLQNTWVKSTTFTSHLVICKSIKFSSNLVGVGNLLNKIKIMGC